MSKNDKATAANGDTQNTPEIDPEIVKKLTQLRAQVRESFGKVVMSLMALPRYRHQTIGDLQHLVLEPLIRDRVAMAYPSESEGLAQDISGLAIWASVSEEVDAKIREQIRAGVFPVRLKADEWASGEINWLMDVIAPDQPTTVRVITNFKQVIKGGDLRLHPLITRLVDRETLEKMGAQQVNPDSAASDTAAPEKADA
ncbi:MAG TPA: toxin-activating lysine-acyltransferase [Roseovarius sp.]|nr:toxin-activating lysine-acyltransferase [Roseovarius sp.]